MLLCDLLLYRALLRRLTLSELLSLYERTAPDYGVLARIIDEELDTLCSYFEVQEIGELLEYVPEQTTEAAT